MITEKKWKGSRKYKNYSEEELQQQLFVIIFILFDSAGKPKISINVTKVILAIIATILLRLRKKKKNNISFPKRRDISIQY